MVKILGECQCCARQIGLKKGLIAHHGYTRPQYGWQTASCMGAISLPFAKSRDRLGDMLALMEREVDTRKKRITELELDAEGLIITLHHSRRTSGHWKPPVPVTAATFDEARKNNHDLFYFACLRDWKTIRLRELAQEKRVLNGLHAEIHFHQKRYNEWVAS